jgi:hypothetical protein
MHLEGDTHVGSQGDTRCRRSLLMHDASRESGRSCVSSWHVDTGAGGGDKKKCFRFFSLGNYKFSLIRLFDICDHGSLRLAFSDRVA